MKVIAKVVIGTILNEKCIEPVMLAQSEERPPHEREVVGSIPGRVIPKTFKMGPSAI